MAKDVENTIDELYLLLDNGGKELNLYVERAKQDIKENSITSLQIHQLIEVAKK